ncbi:hypothetical protein AB840_11275 [Megasphaera cerevisiae DSM 20462]|uniref:Uncharacterized protein n=1 Tax=Megasphaera cerevisiae DSM 20462 TaxID=1122219 RepID=A0A0J6WTJ3_9FIRM|nr:hypothetical protein [Megasphaera cerevisiae]KMO85849.1 hypothetical protein AB840_11275 [Megasphaera cerevisiae DSM 20462]SJZ58796.1 hypothetical protein SAMN05660900_00859 [Megasphaera cerevisiae DSM 20462]
MVTILADRCLAFATGGKDKFGAPETVKVTIGFNDVPEWVIDTPYFQAAKRDGLVQVAGYSEEKAMGMIEENKQLKERIRQLEEEKELQSTSKAVKEAVEKAVETVQKPIEVKKTTKKKG